MIRKAQMFPPVLEIWLNDVIMWNRETRSPEVEKMEAGTISALFLLPVSSSLATSEAILSQRFNLTSICKYLSPRIYWCNPWPTKQLWRWCCFRFCLALSHFSRTIWTKFIETASFAALLSSALTLGPFSGWRSVFRPEFTSLTLIMSV